MFRKALLTFLAVLWTLYILIFLNIRSISIDSSQTLLKIILLEKKLDNIEKMMPRQKHDRENYENGWILNVDSKKLIVTLQTDLTKTFIRFKVLESELSGFRNIVPVTLECKEEINGKCNFKKPFKAYIKGHYVDVIEIS